MKSIFPEIGVNPDPLSIFRTKPYTEIKEWMTPDQIADIISDKLIENIRKKFEESEKKFLKLSK